MFFEFIRFLYKHIFDNNKAQELMSENLFSS